MVPPLMASSSPGPWLEIWVVYYFMYSDKFLYYFMYWHLAGAMVRVSTTGRAHMRRQVPECGWATHRCHEHPGTYGTSQVVFGHAGGVTAPEVIPIHRVHAIHWAHLLVADKAIYNSHSGGDMQTEQGHIEQAIVRGNVVSIVVWSTVLFAECVSRIPGLTPGCPEISCQHLFLRDLGRISNASPSTSQLCLPAPCGHSFLFAASGRRLSLYHGPYLGVDRRTPHHVH